MAAVPIVYTGFESNARSMNLSQRWQGPRRTALNDEAILSQTVSEIMTTGRIVTCSPTTTLDDALELIVEHHVTGLPVVDEENKVVGIISDFDLLALEGVSEEEKTGGLFPTADKDWNSFFEVQKLVEKNAGTTCVVCALYLLDGVY